MLHFLTCQEFIFEGIKIQYGSFEIEIKETKKPERNNLLKTKTIPRSFFLFFFVSEI